MEQIQERGRTKTGLKEKHRNRKTFWEMRAEENARRVEAGEVSLRDILLEDAKIIADKETREGVDFRTELFTERVFEEEVRYLVSFCSRFKLPLGALYIDIDRFKEINDKHGHKVGDRVLKVFAETLLKAVRESDHPARIGGEEFAVLLPGAEQGTLGEIGERIRKETENLRIKRIKGLPSLKITVSVGGTMLRENDTPETLMERADEATYQAKNEGRNRVVVVE